MAILYPHQIANVLVRGTAFEGNIVSVGTDTLYPYDYSDPVVAIETEPANSLFLLYPSYYPLSDGVVNGAKNPILRGMGDGVNDVVNMIPAVKKHIKLGAVLDHFAQLMSIEFHPHQVGALLGSDDEKRE